MTSSSLLAIGCGLFLLPILLPFAATSDQAAAVPAAPNRYIGSSACKNCHEGVEKGEVHEKWSKSEHANAFDVLGTPEAKEVGKKHGVDDPQKSPKCLECHVTAYGVDAKEIKRGFKPQEGVQCESCHGPGENHFKVRFKEAQTGAKPAPIAADEIKSGRDIATCTKCHNEKSPTYKPFCFKERMEQIEHLDPRKKRNDEELAKLRETCTPDCPKCSDKKADGDGKKDGGK